MDNTLYYLCKFSLDIMDGDTPIPARIIAEKTGVSVYTARKRLRNLSEQGFSEKICVNISPNDEPPFPYHGWAITKKARDTEEYKKAKEEENNLCKKIFGFSVW